MGTLIARATPSLPAAAGTAARNCGIQLAARAAALLCPVASATAAVPCPLLGPVPVTPFPLTALVAGSKLLSAWPATSLSAVLALAGDAALVPALDGVAGRVGPPPVAPASIVTAPPMAAASAWSCCSVVAPAADAPPGWQGTASDAAAVCSSASAHQPVPALPSVPSLRALLCSV